MNSSLLESLPDHCLELILDKLILDDFDNFITCCKRLNYIGKGVNEMRKIRLHEVIKQNRPAKWQLLHNGESIHKYFLTPGPRFGSTLVYLDNSIYLFGGATVNWTTFNDLWRFDLKERQWSRRIPSGTCPPPRASGHGILYQDKLIIIGGFELKFHIHAKRSSNWDNLPWVYDFSANNWTMMPVDTSSIMESPRDDEFNSNFHISPTSVGQSACLMLGDRIILFGGAKALLNQSQGIRRPGAIQPYYLSDQTLSLCIPTATITRVRTFGDISPAKRCGHSAVALDRNRMLLVGGYLGPNTKGTEDMWLLTYVEGGDGGRCRCPKTSRSSPDWRESQCWYWTAVLVDQPLQPLSQFVRHAQIVPGGTAASSSTLVILGGASDEVEDAMFPPTEVPTASTPVTTLIEPHRSHNKTQDELTFRRKFRAAKRSNQLIVHAADLAALTAPCQNCDLFDPLDCKHMRWIAPLARCQDLGNAPNVRQGFSVVAGPCSLFLFGGLMFRSVFTRPVYLLNDLMVRDDETEDTFVKGCSDLHELTYRRSAIVL